MSKQNFGLPDNFFGTRLREVRKKLGLTQAQFAEPLSITSSYVSDMEKGKACPSEAVLREMVDTYRMNRIRLETGKGELFEEGVRFCDSAPPTREKLEEYGKWQADISSVDGKGPQPLTYDGPEEAIARGYVQVPRYEIAASAGGGAMVYSEQIVDHLAFKADWLKVSLGLSPSHVAVISVIGDSMEPYLDDGDLILVDLSVTHIENNAIYVLQFGDSLLVKRVQVKLDGEVIVKSDNPRYEPETFHGDAAERLRVVGRMVRRLVR